MEYIILVLILLIYGFIFFGIVNRYNELYEEYEKLKKEAILSINIDDIHITKDFKKNKPSDNKMRTREEYFINNGRFKTVIKIDDYNVLRDGYTSYLLAKKYNIKNVEFIRV